MSRQVARVRVDELNRVLSGYGVTTHEVLHPAGGAGLEYRVARGRTPVATVEQAKTGLVKQLAALPLAVAGAVAGHAAAFSNLVG